MENERHSTLHTPVLIIGFNRPDLLTEVMKRVNSVRPAKIYIAIDGPREKSELDKRARLEIESVIERFETSASVNVLFRQSNLGCRDGVSQAIDWFFGHEEAGIILEDDCLPDPTFFSYCEELLHKYQHNNRVFSIAGYRAGPEESENQSSYTFSRYPQIWGWATWRRVWEGYDSRIEMWPHLRKSDILKKGWKLRLSERKNWTYRFDAAYREEVDTWDYQLTFHALNTGGLTVIPNRNLVSNLGFDDRATHTKKSPVKAERAALPLEFPLIHPKTISVDYRYDRWMEKSVFRTWRGIVPRPVNRFLLRLRTILQSKTQGHL